MSGRKQIAGQQTQHAEQWPPRRVSQFRVPLCSLRRSCACNCLKSTPEGSQFSAWDNTRWGIRRAPLLCKGPHAQFSLGRCWCTCSPVSGIWTGQPLSVHVWKNGSETRKLECFLDTRCSTPHTTSLRTDASGYSSRTIGRYTMRWFTRPTLQSYYVCKATWKGYPNVPARVQ